MIYDVAIIGAEVIKKGCEHDVALLLATEGCLVLNKRQTKRGYIPQVAFTNSDVSLLNSFLTKVNGGAVTSRTVRGNKRVYSWRVYSFREVLGICQQIRPELPSKIEQCDLLIEYCKRRLNKVKFDSRDSEIFLKIERLNKRGISGTEVSHYDAIIIGAGPSGLATAHTLKLNKILLLDKGNSIDNRSCPAIGTCVKCQSCSITSGWGGAGAFSDGKLVWGEGIGGNMVLDDIALSKTLEFFGRFCKLPPEVTSKSNENIVNSLLSHKIKYVPSTTIHLGTDGCLKFCKNIYEYLRKKIDILTNTKVVTVVRDNDRWLVNEKWSCKYLILAVGREGTRWFRDRFARELSIGGNRVDMGLRIETNYAITKSLTDMSHDFKLKYTSSLFDDVARTFCANPRGYVITEKTEEGLITCNGHSYKGKRSDNTNFAILVSIPFSEPINPLQYSSSSVRLANSISDGVIVQRLGDLKKGRRTTSTRLEKSIITPTLQATPGDLSLVLPFRYLKTILDMLEAMGGVIDGLAIDDTLLYGIEIKLFNNQLDLVKGETKLPNLFAVGDGSGVSRGIIQAAASGIVAADVINKRYGQATNSMV